LIHVTNWLNVHTVPPGIFCNTRARHVRGDRRGGGGLDVQYFDKDWNEDGQSPQAFFDRRTLECPSSTTNRGTRDPVKVQQMGGNEGDAGSCQTTAGMVTGEGR